MTAQEQIKVFIKVGCLDGITEIRHNNSRPLTSDRLNFHIEEAISTGLVARVEALVEAGGTPLSDRQVERLTNRCLQLGWTVDALCASKLGTISEQIRDKLIKALVANQIVENQDEAVELLKKSE